MRGEFLPVWSETWRDIWSKLAKHPDAPEDLFSELYRAFTTPPVPPVAPPTPTDFNEAGEMLRAEDRQADAEYRTSLAAYARQRARYEEALRDDDRAKPAFRAALTVLATSEKAIVAILEKSFGVINDYDVDGIRNHYFLLVAQFIEKFSLRYDLRRPFTLHPTLTGIFAGLVRELKVMTKGDAQLHQLMGDFEESIRDLKADSSANRIKTCIQKQMNLLEAIGQKCPTVTGNTLGQICEQLGTLPNAVWPHDRVKDAMKDLYKFASDYPGIRHAGTAANARRDIEMRDMVAISVLLAGFTPYLSHEVDSNLIFGG